MKIVNYKSLIFPRCIPTNRLIARLRRGQPEIEIEEVELLTNLSRAINDGVKMLPTLIVAGRQYHHAPRMAELLDSLEKT